MTRAQRKALVIGISDYTNLQKLNFCKNDGKEVYEILSSLGYEIADKFKLVGAILVEVGDRSDDLTRKGTKEFTIVQFTSALLGRKEN